MKGIPLFIPYSLRSKAVVPTIAPEPVPSPEPVNVSFSALVTPRIVKLLLLSRAWMFQRGFLVCISRKKFNFTTYIFNPGWAKPTLVFEAGFDF
jgi:hypothetical protein